MHENKLNMWKMTTVKILKDWKVVEFCTYPDNFPVEIIALFKILVEESYLL
jgi:hypothetical protein